MVGRSLARIILLAFFCFYGTSTIAQNLSTKDSIRAFTNSVLNLVEKHSLYANQINWETYRTNFTEKVLVESSLTSTLPHFVSLWDTLNDYHSGIRYADRWYGLPSPLDTNALNENMRGVYRNRKKKATVETAFLSDGYGYIRIPTISTLDDTTATQQAAQIIQDSLCYLVQQNVKGWIVDLRQNLGGNMYAMLGGIHQLVKKDTFSYLLDQNDSTISYWVMQDSAIFEGNSKQIDLPKTCTLSGQQKVAVLTGPLTASSGEITALAFLNQENTIIIGEPSAGYMTGNELYRLPFGARIALAEVYETDRYGNKITHIEPGKLVTSGDDFEELLNDKKIQAALNWLAR